MTLWTCPVINKFHQNKFQSLTRTIIDRKRYFGASIISPAVPENRFGVENVWIIII